MMQFFAWLILGVSFFLLFVSRSAFEVGSGVFRVSLAVLIALGVATPSKGNLWIGTLVFLAVSLSALMWIRGEVQVEHDRN